MNSASKNKKSADVYEPTSLLFTKWLLWLYLMAFFFIYPLYFENKYYNMGEAKWHFYMAITFGMRWGHLPVPGLLVLTAICAVWYLVTLLVRGDCHVRDLWKKMSTLDRFVFAYLICVVLASLVAPDKTYVLWGYDGWYMGLMAQISFVLLYFLVSRFCSPGAIFYVAAFAVSGIVFLIAVLNRFGMDPLGMYDGLDMNVQAHFFVTTMGNTTWYGCMLCVMLAAGLGVFCSAEKLWVRILSGAFCFIGFMSAVTTDSDAIFAGIFAMFIALLYFSFSDNRRFKNFWQALALCLASFKCMGLLQQAFRGRAVVLGNLCTFLSQSKVMWILLLIAAVLMITVTFLDGRDRLQVEKISWLRKMYLIVILAGIGLYVLYLVLNTTGHLPGFIKSSTNNYFLFNNDWGDLRGGSWKAAVGTIFKSFADHPINAIFGWGPDCLSVGVYTYYAEQLRAAFGDAVLTAAHNEWLNMFVNYGIVGGAVYLGIFVSAVRTFAREAAEKKELVPVIVALLAYFGVDFFCYQQIISTPIIFVMLGLGEYYSLKKNSKG